MNTFEKIAHLAQVETIEKYAGQTAAAISGAVPGVGTIAAPVFAEDGSQLKSFGGQLVGSGLGALTGLSLSAMINKKRLNQILNILQGYKGYSDKTDKLIRKAYFRQLGNAAASAFGGASLGGGLGAYLGHGPDKK